MKICWRRCHWNGSVLGFWLWGLLCKYLFTYLVITDLIPREIYISIYIYIFLIFWMCYNFLHEIFPGIESTCGKWLLFWLYLPLVLLAEEALLFQNPVIDVFTAVSFILLRRTWLQFMSDEAGLGCAMQCRSFLVMAVKAAKPMGIVTSIIWHVCGWIVNNVLMDWVIAALETNERE